MVWVKVILRQALPSYDRVYTYQVPEPLEADAVPGRRVLFPFGRGDRLEEGYIFAYADEPSEKVKELAACLDPYPLLLPNQLKLVSQMKQRYGCTYGQAISVMLPGGVKLQLAEELELTDSGELHLPEEFKVHWTGAKGTSTKGTGPKAGLVPLADLLRAGYSRGEIRSWEDLGYLVRQHDLKQKIQPKTVEYTKLTDEEEATQLLEDQALGSIQQEEVVRFLLAEGETPTADLCQACEVKRGTLKTLQKKNLVTFERKRPEVTTEAKEAEAVFSTEEEPPLTELDLTKEQQAALAKIREALEKPWQPGEVPEEFLLFGITGSGKTEVYLKAVSRALELGKTALVLVPEISLTPQMTSRFERAFPGETVVMHSRLTPRERFDCWERIRLGQASIVIGARSAVFTPLTNLGLIVIDEEQESSYQSEMSPRYQASTIARLRSRNEGAVLVLGSATPSLETWVRAQEGKAMQLNLPERPGSATIPQTEIVDLRRSWNSDTDGLLSQELVEAMRQALGREEQVLLFLNRRGYASTCLCRTCGENVECPNCAVGLTYHSDRKQLVCHYCGYTTKVPTICPSCGEEDIILAGAGTQKLETLCRERFPEVTIIRMDQDETRGQGAHAKLLQQFQEAKAAILIGTQMIAKGHDFPRLTVAAVLQADQMLGRNDFRAAENAFQLMTQTAGRAGRRDLPGKVFIQGFNVDHYAVVTAAKQDYPAFVQEELPFRQALKYPPFSVLATIGINSEMEQDCEGTAALFYEALQNLTKRPEWQQVEVLRPGRSQLQRLQGRWRWQMLLRTSPEGGTKRLSTLWQQVGLAKVPKGVRVSFTLDPA